MLSRLMVLFRLLRAVPAGMQAKLGAMCARSSREGRKVYAVRPLQAIAGAGFPRQWPAIGAHATAQVARAAGAARFPARATVCDKVQVSSERSFALPKVCYTLGKAVGESGNWPPCLKNYFRFQQDFCSRLPCSPHSSGPTTHRTATA